MKVGIKNYTTLWINSNKVNIIDQTKLPFKFTIKELSNLNDFCCAIKNMEVRGAPLIGITGAFGFAFEIQKNPSDSNIKKAFKLLFNTRPTAINLKWALDLIYKEVKVLPRKLRGEHALRVANILREDDIINCFKIGLNGYKILSNLFKKKKRTINILTHCNAGWLATIDWGTALAPIFLASRNGIPVHVWVDETRPRNQGALLTAWELNNEKIPNTVIVDNAGGFLMQNRKVDLCLVGSDRTTKYGDVCNKIGTYLKAVAAYDNKIPFYVALPFSTIDLKISNIKNIPIESRDDKELSNMTFEKNGKISTGNIYLKNSKIYNPAFDVTPKKYITRLITENGILKPKYSEIMKYVK